jgi:hypothetical protein
MKRIFFALFVILHFIFSVQSHEHSLEALFFSYATYTKDVKEIREWTCGWCQKISNVTVVNIHSEIGSNTRAIVASTPKYSNFRKNSIPQMLLRFEVRRIGRIGSII